MNHFFASILTISLLLLPAAAVQASSHTNIPDTHKYVANEIENFTRFVNKPDISNEELSEALSDLSNLLMTYQRILERRSNTE